MHVVMAELVIKMLDILESITIAQEVEALKF